MKAKLTTAIASTLLALSAQCVTVTNTVTIISNIYNRIAREYYTTNNIVHDINYNYNDYTTNTTVNYDVSQEAVVEAQRQAGLASGSATAAANSASAAAGSATSAASQYDRVVAAANSGVTSINSATQSGVSSINSTGNSMLTTIRNEKVWFDEHFGEMVTNVNISVTTNIYHNEDEVAREMAASSYSIGANTNWEYRLCFSKQSTWGTTDRYNLHVAGVEKASNGIAGVSFKSESKELINVLWLGFGEYKYSALRA